MFRRQIDTSLISIFSYSSTRKQVLFICQDALEEASEDNNRLTSDIRSVTTKFQDEELRSAKLAKEVEEANERIKKERYEAQERLNEQKEKLQAEMRAKVEATKKKMADESSKQVEELKKKEAAKLAQQKKEAERKMADAESRMKEQEAVPPPPVVDLDTASLLQLQEAQVRHYRMKIIWWWKAMKP